MPRAPKCPFSKEEIIAAIQRCADKLGHVPSSTELHKETGIGMKSLRRCFGTFTQALRTCGMEREGGGHKLGMDKLFANWAEIARTVGEIPTLTEYQLHSRYSAHPLRTRFGHWSRVAAGMLEYAEKEGLHDQWADVLDIVRKHCNSVAAREWTYTRTKDEINKPRKLTDRPLYGAPIAVPPLMYAPVNEAGLMCLFIALATRLGFAITWVGTAFPDIEAVREVEAGRWQRVRIELEYESKNFQRHYHNPEECDLIVCWEHDWPECPLEVIELKPVVMKAEKE